MKKIPKKILDEHHSIEKAIRITRLSDNGYTYIYKDHIGFNPKSVHICIKNYVL